VDGSDTGIQLFHYEHIDDHITISKNEITAWRDRDGSNFANRTCDRENSAAFSGHTVRFEMVARQLINK